MCAIRSYANAYADTYAMHGEMHTYAQGTCDSASPALTKPKPPPSASSGFWVNWARDMQKHTNTVLQGILRLP